MSAKFIEAIRREIAINGFCKRYCPYDSYKQLYEANFKVSYEQCTRKNMKGQDVICYVAVLI